MKKIIYIVSTLNIAAFKQNSEERFTKEWIEYRISIFMKYTLQSLKAQTNQEFIAVIQYHDRTENIVQEALRKYPKLPTNVKFLKKSNYKEHVRNTIMNYDYFYLTRLDSDDMYKRTHVQFLHDYNPKENTLVLINVNGYLYDTKLKQLLKFHHGSSNYYTFIYNTKKYLSGIYNQAKYIPVNGHKGVINLPNEIIREKNFIRTIHSKNTLEYDLNPGYHKLWLNHKNHIKDKRKVRRILFDFMGRAVDRII
ncbi:glycosyltransferase family A protein [Oceanirhabdus seepicola]|uniref:Glycosyltransferase family 2 protein n=1 Tax=Oceanirhabdus seepicola TaxID=2828781 RepID=A0A9J6NZ15_9CLOT|nr:glycosyltransferase family A protein [Oceanirhabdus seepicola]MCM1989300.1 glycosyltransferase family 2 protein [Oceanirhabdus seepicola]